MKSNRLGQPIVIALGLFLLIIIISMTYGFQYLVSKDSPYIMVYYYTATTLFLIGLAGVTLSYLYFSRDDRDSKAPMLAPIGFIMTSLSLSLSTFFYSKELHPISWLYIIGPTLLIASFLALKVGLRAGIVFLFLVGLGFDIFLINAVPNTVEAANMLPVIEAASREFLAGDDPYRRYEGVALLPFGYLPGLWLPYAGLVALGIDARILNLVSLIIIVWIFERGFRLEPPARRALAVTFYPLLLSPPVTQMIIHGHIWPYWVFLLLTALFLYRDKFFPAAIFFGLTLATRQPALFFAGPLAVYIYKRLNLASLIKCGVVTLVVYGAIVIPFVIRSPEEGIWLRWYMSHSIGFDSEFQEMNIIPQIAAANYFYGLNIPGLLKYTQLGALIICMSMVWRSIKASRPNVSYFLFVAGIGYVWFIFFNGYVARYLYLPGFLLTALALTLWLGAASDKNAAG